jgi:hypothetical protein
MCSFLRGRCCCRTEDDTQEADNNNLWSVLANSAQAATAIKRPLPGGLAGAATSDSLEALPHHQACTLSSSSYSTDAAQELRKETHPHDSAVGSFPSEDRNHHSFDVLRTGQPPSRRVQSLDGSMDAIEAFWELTCPDEQFE